MKNLRSLTVVGILLAGLAFNSAAMAFAKQQLDNASGMSRDGATASTDMVFVEAALSSILI